VTKTSETPRETGARMRGLPPSDFGELSRAAAVNSMDLREQRVESKISSSQVAHVSPFSPAMIPTAEP
jgi:hypothetical protein